MTKENTVKAEEGQEEQEAVLTEEEQQIIESEGAVDGYANQAVEIPSEDVLSKEEQAIEDGKTEEEIEAAKKEDEAAATAEVEAEKTKAEAAAVKAEAEKTPEQKKADEDAAAVKKAEEEAKDPFMKIETELAKDEGKEDLKEFTDREKAYFFQMRRDRKNRQKAESDRDAALFRETKLKKQIEENPLKEKDPFEGRDDTDFMTIKDVKALIEKEKASTVSKVVDDDQGQENPAMRKYLELQDNAARALHPDDYDAVMELTEELINKNPDNMKQLAAALEKGESVAELGYSLIKGDPAFAELFPMAKIRWDAAEKVKGTEKKKTPEEEKTPTDLEKEKKAKEAQEKLLKNKSKVKTTGNINAGLVNDTGEELTAQQIVDMSDMEFSRLPKPTRDRYLKLYG